MSLDFESLFHASAVELLVPSFSQCPTYPSDPSSSKSWWTEAQAARTRVTAFLDEKLVYYVGMSVDDGSESDEPSSELRRFLSQLQLSISVSFLPPMLAAPQARGQETANTLLPPDTTPTGGESNLDFPPVTPMPRPSVKDGDEQYAGVDGQVIWEGDVTDKYKLFKDDAGGWVAVWKGEVHVAYVRTNIQDPVLSLTASVTLRDGPVGKGHKKGNFSIDTVSTRTGEDDYGDEGSGGQRGMAGIREMDLLGGLTGDNTGLPATRLGQSLRQDLSLPDPATASTLPFSAYTPTSLPSNTPTAAGGPPAAHSSMNEASTSTLRKSFRRVLGLSPGLRVRMRTLFLPQLLPLSTASNTDDEDNEGEKKVVLCVEVENPETESAGMSFEIESVNVEIGGKGGQATASLVCQPEQRLDGGKVFPLRLGGVEQYNLLYAVSIASAPEERNGGTDEALLRNMGRGDDTRPAAITLVGRPFRPVDGDEVEYPTNLFSSRWNCQLDLTAFYASLANGANAVPTVASASTNRLSKSSFAPAAPPPNAVAGDKRYSLATIMSQGSNGSNRDSRRLTAQRPIMPSQAMSSHHARMPSTRQPPASGADEGLLVSVKLLSRSTPTTPSPIPASASISEPGQRESTVKPFEPFSIEVFVHNRTDEVRRFRLSIPPQDGETQIRDVMDKRRSQNPPMSQDDPVLRKLLAKHLASAPAVVPLETDVRCGPLLPGASLAARLRFVALRKGVHRVEKLVVTGMGDDWNFVMSPVVDVIVE